MENGKRIRVGIGFATGRKSFQQVLKTYVYNFRESGLTQNQDIHLSLFVAYDLQYFHTKKTDYTNINDEVRSLIGDTCFIGKPEILKEAGELTEKGVLTQQEARFFFRHDGYAAKRNAVLYAALKNKIDYLLFLDDDEYPMAVTKTRSTAVWGGQHVLSTHLKHIGEADITHGHHCGYISPIPYVRFNKILAESDFQTFIEAISNDIVNWETIRSVMNNGGVTYADTKVLTNDAPQEEPEVNHSKFISGSNLCLNLTRPDRVFPFFNPPGARGEDTFLGTCLQERRVLRVPCYAFHDGFSTYHHLMDGVLPTTLKYIQADSDPVVTRFYRACIGWIRYKPLLLYITRREEYEKAIEKVFGQLNDTLPRICLHFGRTDFFNILRELERYHKNVEKHYAQFRETQRIWQKITLFLQESAPHKARRQISLCIEGEKRKSPASV